MDAFLDKAESSSDDIKRKRGSYREIPFVHLSSSDRRVHVFSAYPKDDLHVRSNSKIAFQRVLDAVLEDASDTPSLGDSEEFAYIRTLMPLGAEEEDGFVYLSDPFIRHMVGPQLKLTERRRRLCKNHLHMIGHAAVLYQTQFGKVPATLDDLFQSGCAPGVFGRGNLVCSCGGTYSLSQDGLSGVCTHHGRPGAMVPCCEIALDEVTPDEAKAYEQFEREYSQYWRTFFDPIAIRMQIKPDKYRLETIVLPLIDNSLYTGLASVLGGEPATLEIPPVPDSNIFSVVVKLDKEMLLARSGWTPPEPQARDSISKARQISADAQKMRQIALGMHNYHDVHKRFPANASYSDEKKPLLSWRVLLLPYLGHDTLYRRFHLDEPWDSEHNRQLIGDMPKIYLATDRVPTKPGTTTFVRVVGADTLCTGTDAALRIRDTRDGTSNTALTVQVGEERAVEWTKPDDVPFNKQSLRKSLFSYFEDVALIGFSDGSTRVLPDSVADETLWAIFTRAGGETVSNVGRPVSNRNPSLPMDLGEFVGPEFEQQLGMFLTKGLSDKIGFHVCDTEPMFDFQLIGFLGQSLGSFSGRGGLGMDDDFLPIVLAIASLNAPVYVSVPLEDTDVTDEFLNSVDDALARFARRPERNMFFQFQKDFYQLPLSDGTSARSMGLQLGPVKWRFFWARIEESLYVASKVEVLEQLVQAHISDGAADTTGHAEECHAMMRIRPENWKRVLPSYRLGWAERHRLSCLHNVGRLSNLARLQTATSAVGEETAVDDSFQRMAAEVYGVQFFCPEGGDYHADGHQVTCSIHQNAADPRQRAVPREDGTIDRMLRQFKGMTVGLTFLEDGLHAVVTIDR
jgi:hypothetical protein